jgi:hypothetical protein
MTCHICAHMFHMKLTKLFVVAVDEVLYVVMSLCVFAESMEIEKIRDCITKQIKFLSGLTGNFKMSPKKFFFL